MTQFVVRPVAIAGAVVGYATFEVDTDAQGNIIRDEQVTTTRINETRAKRDRNRRKKVYDRERQKEKSKTV